MADVFSDLASSLAKMGAPVLGSLIGTAIGGPVGTAVGGLAGKAIEELAGKLGTAATPEAVLNEVSKETSNSKVTDLEAVVDKMIPIWTAQLSMAQEAQTAEITKGFSTWDSRRSFAHYTTWGLTLIAGVSTIVLTALGHAQAAISGNVFSTCITLTMSWMAVNSGGKALTDFAREWKAK